jgi:hypothetical protein
VSWLWVHCHKEANDDYGNDHERMKEHVWSLLMFAIFTQKNVSSFAIVDYNCNIKVAVGVHGAWYMISTYWRFT